MSSQIHSNNAGDDDPHNDTTTTTGNEDNHTNTTTTNTSTTPSSTTTRTAPTTTTPMSPMLKISTPVSQEEVAAKEARIRKVILRDFVFLVLAFLGARIMSYVEVNASRAELRQSGSGLLDDLINNGESYSFWSWFWNEDSLNCGVIDTGYILTTPLHTFLKHHRGWNDWLAAINSVILFLPGIYTSYVTFWRGDFELAFRYFATHLLRSLCGWFTYLPPHPSYLPSNYDFPDIWQCLFIKDCSQASEPEALPFVSFFSGHVATLVCTANHMYLHGYKKMGITCHIMNVFQIVRFLATRGHYSIDIIVAWYVAIYVSNRAGRLGRYFSQGTSAAVEEVMPENATQVFETMTGISDVMAERVIPKLMKKQDLEKVLERLLKEEGLSEEIRVESSSETTATILAEELERLANARANARANGSANGNASSSSSSTAVKKTQ